MAEPLNAVAEQIVRAQSTLTDLTRQATEIQTAITRQQAFIESLMPLATWGDDPAVAAEPETEPETEIEPSPEAEHEEPTE